MVVAAVSVLAVIVIIAINPQRQLAQVRNSRRRINIDSIVKAYNQYVIDNDGISSLPLTTSYQEICAQDAADCTGYVDISSALVPQYITEIPEDPSTSSENGTGYFIAINPDNDKVSVGAAGAELEQLIAINALTESLFDGADNTWTPTEIATDLWLDAAETSSLTFATSSVPGVQTWLDKSGNDRTVIQSQEANRPQVIGNGIYFDGVNDFLDADLDFLAGTNHQAYIVANSVSSFSNFYGATRGNSGSESLHVGYSNTTEWRVNYWGNNFTPSISSNYVSLGTNLLSFEWNPGSGKEVFANGFSEGSNSSAGNVDVMRDGGRIVCVVQQGCMETTINEIIFVTGSDVTTDTDERLTGYLAHKWGIESQLPPAHPYASDPPSGWSPQDINTQLWLDASDSSTVIDELSSVFVSQWNDLSGNDRHASQADQSLMPAYQSSLETLSFVGGDFLALDLDFLANSDHSAFIVIETTGPFRSNIYGAVDTSEPASHRLHVGFSDGSYGLGGDYQINNWGDDARFTPTSVFRSNDVNLLQYEWLIGTQKSVFANGHLEGSVASAGGIETMSGGGRLIGAFDSFYDRMNADVYEVIFITDSNLTTENYDRITGYLAHKWGLEGELPIGHPYKDAAPTLN